MKGTKAAVPLPLQQSGQNLVPITKTEDKTDNKSLQLTHDMCQANNTGYYGTILNGIFLRRFTEPEDRWRYVIQLHEKTNTPFTASKLSNEEAFDKVKTYLNIKENQPNLFLSGTDRRPGCTGKMRRFLMCFTCYSMTSRVRFAVSATLLLVCSMLFSGFIYYLFNEHISKVFIRQEVDSITDIEGAIIHTVAAIGFVGVLAVTVVTCMDVTENTPRLCCPIWDRKHGCFSEKVKENQCKRRIFEEIMAKDTSFNYRKMAINENEYDSDKDDPIVTAVFIHLKEAGYIKKDEKKDDKKDDKKGKNGKTTEQV